MPSFAFDGQLRPRAGVVAAYISSFWLATEPILYIGKTDDPLSTRIGAMFAHRLGCSSPHKGGHWLKTLSILPDLWVHWAPIGACPIHSWKWMAA